MPTKNANRRQYSRIQPPEGSRVHSDAGILKTGHGIDLAQLQAVHAWLMQRDGLPAAVAVGRVFGVFLSDAASEVGMRAGADEVRKCLHLTDPSQYAEPLTSFAGRLYLREVAQHVPYVPHHRFDRGTIEALLYSLSLMAGEVWAAPGQDVDLNRRLDGNCAAGDFPSAAAARAILGRLAIPAAAAHVLWGWGTVVQEAAAAPFPLAGWNALVAYRKKNPGASWGVGNQIEIGMAKLRELQEKGKSESVALDEMGRELGMKRGRQPMKRALFNARKRARKAAPAAPPHALHCAQAERPGA